MASTLAPVNRADISIIMFVPSPFMGNSLPMVSMTSLWVAECLKV